MDHQRMITTMKHSWKTIYLAAKKIQDLVMAKKIMATNTQIQNLTVINKAAVKMILTITQTNPHHIRSKITLVILEMLGNNNNHNIIMNLRVTLTKTWGLKAQPQTLGLQSTTLTLLSSNHPKGINIISTNSNSFIMIKRKEASRKSIDKIKSILSSMILQIWGHAEFVVVNSILTVFLNTSQTVNKYSKKKENNLMHNNRELSIIIRKS